MQGFLLTKLYDIKHLLYYNFLPQYSCMKLHYKWRISVYCVCGGDYMSMGCVCMVADNLIKSPHTNASIDIALTLTTLK